MDYFGFQPELYELRFKSRGDAALSQRVVEVFKQVSCAGVSSNFWLILHHRQDTSRALQIN